MLLSSGVVLAAMVVFADAKPQLGYNSYNDIWCSPNATYLSSTINALVSKGFLAAGYNIFQIDCGWSSTDLQRDSAGALKIDPVNFPAGLAPISQQARNAGLAFGLYGDAGVRACDTTSPSQRLGSLGHEAADAQLFKNLGVSFLKYDNCYADGPGANVNAPKNTRTDFPSRFGAMWNALKAVGISNMLICQWGVPYSSPSGRLQGPLDWTSGISTSFRLSDDIANNWGSVVRIINQAGHISRSGRTSTSFVADADLLHVGNRVLTVPEQETHFSFWALSKSSLMISTNVAGATSDTVRILQNRDLIAINQDDLGKPVTLVQRWTNDRDLYDGPLSNGNRAVLAINWQTASRSLTVNFSSLNITRADVKNLWTGATASGVSSYTATVGAHGSLALRLSNIVTSTPAGSITYYEAERGALASGANTQSCSGCSGSTKVGNIGKSNGGSLTLSGITATATTSTVVFDHVNGDIGWLGGTNLNARTATVSVNGGTAVAVSFPISGYDWAWDVWRGFRVELSGWRVASNNTLTIKAGTDTDWAPDFDRIGVIV